MITPLSCALPNRIQNGPTGSGDERLKILPGTLLHSVFGNEEACEQFYCNYGVNQDYERQLEVAGLRVCARGAHGEARAVELPDHRFFIATLFQPQLSSRPELPHPLLLEFVRAAEAFRETRLSKTSAVSSDRKGQI